MSNKVDSDDYCPADPSFGHKWRGAPGDYDGTQDFECRDCPAKKKRDRAISQIEHAHTHQWFSTETDIVNVRLNNRQPKIDYIHICLVCGQREATDVYGHLYVATGKPFNGNMELWVEVNPHKP